jgi:GNAT superfamily N-acetyltransferase
MEAIMKWPGPDGYWASDEPELIDAARVHDWISRESYWAEGRPQAAMAKAIENSVVIGVYSAEGTQVGFARFVTDFATFAWLCDVFVDSAHRGRRLGTFLVETAVGHPEVRGVRQILAAEPGRSLYARFGFGQLARPERWMERPGRLP